VKTELRLKIKPPALFWIKSVSLTKVQAFGAALTEANSKNVLQSVSK
jgi:hypothetical protein